MPQSPLNYGQFSTVSLYFDLKKIRKLNRDPSPSYRSPFFERRQTQNDKNIARVVFYYTNKQTTRFLLRGEEILF